MDELVLFLSGVVLGATCMHAAWYAFAKKNGWFEWKKIPKEAEP